MSFNVDSLPNSVRNAFQYGALAWPLVVQEGIKAHISLDELTDIVFFLHHPERNGKPIGASETALIEQWKSFRILIKPSIPASPAGNPWSKQKRHIPIDIFALQNSLIDGKPEFAYSFSQSWGDGERWVAITTVSDLVQLVKRRCGEEGYVRSLRLGGHGAVGSFRLGNELVSLETLNRIAPALQEIVPYFRPGDSLIRLDHCNVGNDKELLKKVAKVFGGVAVFASKDSQFANDGEPAFEGQDCVLCGPNVCIRVVTPNMRTRDLLGMIHVYFDPVPPQPSWKQ